MASKRCTGAWLAVMAALALPACAPLDSLPSPRAAGGAAAFQGSAFDTVAASASPAASPPSR